MDECLPHGQAVEARGGKRWHALVDELCVDSASNCGSIAASQQKKLRFLRSSMPDPKAPSTPDPLDVTVPVRAMSTPTVASRPTASHYVPELPLAEELQAMLGGGYVVEGFLGQGGMGAVYRGLQMPLRRPVAIKILAKGGGGDDFAFEERFKREAYAMASLMHPNVVQVYDCGDAGPDHLFISMELLEGGDLSDALRTGQVTPDGALKLILQICDGLQAAHERGIVHRDIKPANIFLTQAGQAKVADFGLAKSFDAQGSFMTKTGMSMGTPDYASPEQFSADPDLDHRADIYSLGVMMYQLLTGVLPRGNYRPASTRAGTDPRIDGVLAKAMEHDRADRQQSIAELKRELLSILHSAPPAPPRATPPAAQPPRNRTTAPATRAARPPGPRQPVPRPPTRRQAPRSEGSTFLSRVFIVGFLSFVAAGSLRIFVPHQTKAAPTPPVAEATKVEQVPQVPAAAAPVPAPVQRPRSMQWEDGLSAWFGGLKSHDSFVPGANGTARLAIGKARLRPVPPDMAPFQDQAVRARVRMSGPHSVVAVAVRCGPDSTGKQRKYEAQLSRFFGRLTLIRSNSDYSGRPLLDLSPPEGFDYDAIHTLELRATGDSIAVILDGVTLGEARDSDLKAGHPEFTGEGELTILGLEYQSLDAG